MEKKLVYLAVPYTHEDPAVKEERFEKVNQVAAILINRGENVFSPISMAHPIAKAGGLPGDWEFWDEFDRAYLECCKKMYVLMLDGWKESTGVKAEIKIAEEFGIEIEYLDYDKIMDVNKEELSSKHICVTFVEDVEVDYYPNEESKDYRGHTIKKDAYAEFDVLADNEATIDVIDDYGVIRGLRKDSFVIE